MLNAAAIDPPRKCNSSNFAIRLRHGHNREKEPTNSKIRMEEEKRAKKAQDAPQHEEDDAAAAPQKEGYWKTRFNGGFPDDDCPLQCGCKEFRHHSIMTIASLHGSTLL